MSKILDAWLSFEEAHERVPGSCPAPQREIRGNHQRGAGHPAADRGKDILQVIQASVRNRAIEQHRTVPLFWIRIAHPTRPGAPTPPCPGAASTAVSLARMKGDNAALAVDQLIHRASSPGSGTWTSVARKKRTGAASSAASLHRLTRTVTSASRGAREVDRQVGGRCGRMTGWPPGWPR